MEVICYSCGRGENPENTLEGIRHCQSINSNWRIEMDLQLTADNEIVLFHDYQTLRTTGKDSRVNELTLAEVRKLNAGYSFKGSNQHIDRSTHFKISLLKDVFEEFPHAKLLLDIHTDDPQIVEIFIDLIESTFINGDFIVVSEYDSIIRKLKKERPNWRYGVPANEAKKMLYSSFIYMDWMFPIKSNILMLPKKYGRINVLSKRVINHAKKRNRPIWAWMYEGECVRTVESKKEMEELESIGVDGIFTEYPEKLLNEIYKPSEGNT